MTKYEIKLYAKDKKTISRFLKFFNQSQNQIKHFPIALNFKRKKKRKNIVAILKSPHINKKAQTQFQQINHTAIGKYFTWENKKSTIHLKKLKNNLFPTLKIRIKRTSNSKNKSKKTLDAKFLLTEKPIFSTFFVKRRQVLIFENQKIDAKKWISQILKNFKKLESFGYCPNQ